MFSRVVLHIEAGINNCFGCERLASLISLYLTTEIVLEIVLGSPNRQVLEIITKKFGKLAKDFKVTAFGASFILKCFNLPPTFKSIRFIGTNLHELEAL